MLMTVSDLSFCQSHYKNILKFKRVNFQLKIENSALYYESLNTIYRVAQIKRYQKLYCVVKHVLDNFNDFWRMK